MYEFFANISPGYLLLPGTLCVYYLIMWARVGQDPKPGTIVPRYEPPRGMSPAAMRYLLTGTTDRKSVAAVLVHLAAQKLISITPERGDYRITPLVDAPPSGIPAEEAAAMRAIIEVQSFVASARLEGQENGFRLRPAQQQHVSLIGSVISGSVNARVERLCFNRNLRYSAQAFASSYLVLLGMGFHFERHFNGVFFLTIWFLFCSLIVGLITVVSVAPMLRDALRGRISFTQVSTAMVPLLMFGFGLAFVDWKIGRSSTPEFAYMMAAVVVINIVFAVLLKRRTQLGQQLLDEVLGFREFLATVEIDRFERMNQPHVTPALLNDYFAYAIALDLKEDWGDHFSSALFATATSSG